MPDSNALLTLCAKSPDRMRDWEQAIIDFDNCKVEIADTDNGPPSPFSKTVLDDVEKRR